MNDAATSWSRLSALVADATGLDFPPKRADDLRRGLASAAKEFGFADVEACTEWLLSAPLTRMHLSVLASHLTIGETYFFREKEALDVLADCLLPELINSRRGREQRLRLWSAGCCTGEEAYSLAILLRQALPDLPDWHVTILATDINPRFLRKAEAGTYGEWAFRGTPPGIKERYFNRTGDGRHVIVPEIKDMVTFTYLNLADGTYPSLATDTNAMDLILCRNVLMYFMPAQARKVIGNLHHALVHGGWLLVSHCEVSQALFPQFVARNFPDATFYQKDDAMVRGRQTTQQTPIEESVGGVLPAREPPGTPQAVTALAPERQPEPPPPQAVPVKASPAPHALAVSLYDQGRYAESADTLLALCAGHTPEPETLSLLARALANLGRLADALTWCDRWIAADKLDSAGHYLRAVVLIEKGDLGEARRSLQRAVYLHPDFVLAHFALGNLARGNGKPGEAAKHFGNTLQLLARYRQDECLAEFDGLTAGRLAETITALTELGSMR